MTPSTSTSKCPWLLKKGVSNSWIGHELRVEANFFNVPEVLKTGRIRVGLQKTSRVAEAKWCTCYACLCASFRLRCCQSQCSLLWRTQNEPRLWRQTTQESHPLWQQKQTKATIPPRWKWWRVVKCHSSQPVSCQDVDVLNGSQRRAFGWQLSNHSRHDSMFVEFSANGTSVQKKDLISETKFALDRSRFPHCCNARQLSAELKSTRRGALRWTWGSAWLWFHHQRISRPCAQKMFLRVKISNFTARLAVARWRCRFN